MTQRNVLCDMSIDNSIYTLMTGLVRVSPVQYVSVFYNLVSGWCQDKKIPIKCVRMC